MEEAPGADAPGGSLAEAVGFEPTVSFPTHDFQSCRFGRSRTPPRHSSAQMHSGTPNGQASSPANDRWQEARSLRKPDERVLGSQRGL